MPVSEVGGDAWTLIDLLIGLGLALSMIVGIWRGFVMEVMSLAAWGWIWVDAWRDRGLVGLHAGQSDAFGDLGSVAVLTLGRLVERIVEGVDPFVARASGQILARAVLISF